MGDGQKVKPLKIEWATQTNGKLLIGSTGVREREKERKTARERGNRARGERVNGPHKPTANSTLDPLVCV